MDDAEPVRGLGEKSGTRLGLTARNLQLDFASHYVVFSRPCGALTIVRGAVVSDELERQQRRQDLVRSTVPQLGDGRDELHRHQVVVLHPHLYETGSVSYVLTAVRASGRG